MQTRTLSALSARCVKSVWTWLLILGRRHLERVLREYVDHYNRERPHRALELRAPQPSPQVIPLRPQHQTAVSRPDRLGGLIHEYAWAA
jgi:putative transposase